MKFLLGTVGFIALLLYSAVFMYSGGLGIYVWGGSVWLGGCILAAVFLRVMFPFTLGAFYCAWHLWGWHWALAMLWALPGLAVALPAMLAAVIEAAAGMMRRRA